MLRSNKSLIKDDTISYFPPPQLVKEKVNKRIEWLDTLRLLACFLVVLTHSAMPAESNMGFWLALLSFIGSPSSELFLSLSGAVLLPVKKDFRSFYKRRFEKLIPPLVFWTFVSLSVYVVIGKYDLPYALKLFAYMPLRPAISVYWFMYAMIGLYLFAPFISYWLREATKRQVEFFLFLWLVNMILPYLNLFSPGIYTATNGNHYWMLNQFAGFLGYWILGYYLRRYPVCIGINRRWFMIMGGTVVYVLVLAMIRKTGEGAGPYYDNLQIGSACLVALIYTLVQNFPIKNTKIVAVITAVAKYSFGIYLTHIIVVREIVWRLFENSSIHPIIRTPLIAILSMGICWSIVYWFSRISAGKKMVGL